MKIIFILLHLYYIPPCKEKSLVKQKWGQEEKESIDNGQHLILYYIKGKSTILHESPLSFAFYF